MIITQTWKVLFFLRSCNNSPQELNFPFWTDLTNLETIQAALDDNIDFLNVQVGDVSTLKTAVLVMENYIPTIPKVLFKYYECFSGIPTNTVDQNT
jgi:hypothetical protein